MDTSTPASRPEAFVHRNTAAEEHVDAQSLPIRPLTAESRRNVRSHVRRALLIAAGTACLALAVVAAFVPVIPTTPFLLLAAAAYVRSSPRLHRWMFTNRVFGEYLTAYRDGRGLPLASKIGTLALLWASIGASAIFGIPDTLWWLKVALVLIAIGVTIHVARLKTLSRS